MRKAFIYGIIFFQIILISSLVRNIQLSIRARHRAVDLEAQKQKLIEEQITLQDELAYVQSDIYTERVARDELQLSKPGETVVIVPDSVIEKAPVQDEAVRTEDPNYLKWWKVLSGQE